MFLSFTAEPVLWDDNHVSLKRVSVRLGEIVEKAQLQTWGKPGNLQFPILQDLPSNSLTMSQEQFPELCLGVAQVNADHTHINEPSGLHCLFLCTESSAS